LSTQNIALLYTEKLFFLHNHHIELIANNMPRIGPGMLLGLSGQAPNHMEGKWQIFLISLACACCHPSLSCIQSYTAAKSSTAIMSSSIDLGVILVLLKRLDEIKEAKVQYIYVQIVGWFVTLIECQIQPSMLCKEYPIIWRNV